MAGTARRHLDEAGMSYGAHLRRAWRVGGAMLTAGCACLIHGLIPGLFTTKASRTIVRLNEEVSATNGKTQPALIEFEI